MTVTAQFADVILPAASFLEKSGTFTNGERRVQRVQETIEPLEGTKPDGQIIVDIMNRMGYEQPDYTPEGVLAEMAEVIWFFKGATWENLGEQGKQWPIREGGVDTKILHTEKFRRGLGKFHYFEFEESKELEAHGSEFPYILTTGRLLEQYNCGTMTRRTNNTKIVGEDLLAIHPKDAKKKGIESGDRVRLHSARGEVFMHAKVSREVKPGILYTTFHFPELMVNKLTSHVHDAETMCPEYKVTAVDVEKVAPDAGKAGAEIVPKKAAVTQ